MRSWTIQHRLILLAMLPAMLVAVSIPLYFIPLYFLSDQLAQLENDLVERGQPMTLRLAVRSESEVIAGNRERLQRLADGARSERDVVAVAIRDGNGRLLAASPAGRAPAPAIAPPVRLVVQRSADRRALVFSAPIHGMPTGPEDILSQSPAPGRVLGSVTVELSRGEILAARMKLLVFGVALACGALVAAMLLAARLSLQISVPLRSLAETVRRIGRGDLEARAESAASGEILELERGVNAMAQELRIARDALEARVREATAELSRQKEKAERASLAKTRFLAAASHDLRQPMHALVLLVGALRAGEAPERAASIIARIQASVDAMQDLFTALLDVSRLDAGAIEAHPRAFALSPVLVRVCEAFSACAECRHRFDGCTPAPAGACEAFSGDAGAKGLSLRIVPTRLWVRADPVLVERIVRNLVSNAVRYTRRGGVLVGCRRRGDAVRVEVWDTGVGIAPEHQQEIFQEFVQLDNPERDRSRGLGLGLAIVQRLARLLDTRIELRSRPGRGSVFSVLLARTPPEAHAQPPPGNGVADTGVLRGSLIMAIDDDAAARGGMHELLRGWGCYTVIAASGAQAMASLEALEREPDLILCDYRLPGSENGIDLMLRLRSGLATRPALAVVTGDTSAGVAAHARRHRIALLYKPVRPAELAALMARLLAPDQA